MRDRWSFDYLSSPALPPLAWVARIRFPRVLVACGSSVQRTASGFFDGTWVGGPDLAATVDSTTPFGAGIVATADGLFIVPHGHTLEGVYVRRAREASEPLTVSNSLAALLSAAGAELMPEVDYVSRFVRVADGIDASPISIPTSGPPVEFHFFENLHVGPDGSLTKVAKPREAPFRSYEDYVARIDTALASAMTNAPGYEPVVALSNGYDSTAMATLAARHGVRTCLTFAHVRPAMSTADTSDSGEATARRLGLPVETVDRLAYLTRDDLPETEFLATGMSGEDVANTAMEPWLRRGLLLTGDAGAALWRYGREPRSDLWRLDISGASSTEFRLRLDYIFVPLPVFGMTEIPSLQQITRADAMKPWSVGGHYDRPIPRRMAEEAGIARGTFATVKHAGTALIHQEGAAALAPASLASAMAFAAAEGASLRLVARPRLRRRERFVLKAARLLRVGRLVRPLAARQRAMIHHEPRSGSILFRWAVAHVRERYASVADLLDETR